MFSYSFRSIFSSTAKWAALLLLSSSSWSCLKAETPYGDLALQVMTMLEDEHFLRLKFDDTMSERTLKSYLEVLDYSRIYFTKEDIEGFEQKFKTSIDDHVRAKSIPAAYEIYSVYEERVADRVALAQKLAQPGVFTYDSSRKVLLQRKDAPWPAAGAEHDQLWRDLIEGDLIRETLVTEAVEKENQEKATASPKDQDTPEGATPDSKLPQANTDAAKDQDAETKTAAVDQPAQPATSKPEKTIYEKVYDRYDRILKRVKENKTEDVATFFIKSIARAYDPHSEYFSQSQYDNFRIGMNKSLTGIGAMLQQDEDQGGATIEALVVGGPAAKGGRLEVKDRVIGVAQGDSAEFADVVDAKLSDIVDLIRGEIGSVVRLKVISSSASATPGEIKLVDITRDKIDLKDSLATADLIITKDPDGKEQKIGWITLPSFYADMDGGMTSTTTDVRKLLSRLASMEGIDGLVVDLRDNGGGSLEEAINMTGLFIRRGPVVQSVDWRGNRDQKNSRGIEALYNGPMVVLCNRASASASEIFAAALQDYGRAVVVGDTSTFGKGTVQQLRPVTNSRINFITREAPTDKGALKLTIQTFFRINGHSTQRHGVESDVVIPSLLDIADVGEASLGNALEVAPIQQSAYKPFSEVPLPLQQLSEASKRRITAGGIGFEYILEDINREKQRIEDNTVTLSLAERRKETAEAEVRRETRKKERIEQFARQREEEKGLFTVYKLTQDNVFDEGLTLAADLSTEQLSGFRAGPQEEDPEDKLQEYPHNLDPYKRETLRVIQDLIAVGETGSTVSFTETSSSPAKPAAPAPATTEVAPN